MADTTNDATEAGNGTKATASASKSSAWEGRYKEVVWAKSGSFPWWPSYVFDPHQLKQSEEGYAKAHRLIGKQYVVLFYADRTLGFISPKDIKPFNEQTVETYSGQKISNKYKAQFPKAIAEAMEDYKRSPEDRLEWYFEAEKETAASADDFDDNEEASYFEEDDAAAASLGFEFDEKEEALIRVSIEIIPQLKEPFIMLLRIQISLLRLRNESDPKLPSPPNQRKRSRSLKVSLIMRNSATVFRMKTSNRRRRYLPTSTCCFNDYWMLIIHLSIRSEFIEERRSSSRALPTPETLVLQLRQKRWGKFCLTLVSASKQSMYLYRSVGVSREIKRPARRL